MSTKTIVTAVLLLFVVVSLAVLVAKETGRNGVSAASSGEPPVGVDSDTGLQQAGAVPGIDYDLDGPERQITVYYFCNTVRCPSCHKIENWSHEAVSASFEDEIEDGIVRWQIINTDFKENQHYIDDYELFTKQVILVERVKGEQLRWRNLGQVWDLLGSQEKFAEYIASEIERFIAGEDDKENPPAGGLDIGGSEL